jgi:hypothetical protein
MKTLPLPKIERKVNDYVILLRNGKTIQVVAEVYDIVVDDEGSPCLYRFYRNKITVLELEARGVEAIAESNSVDVTAVIAAVRHKPRKRKTQ